MEKKEEYKKTIIIISLLISTIPLALALEEFNNYNVEIEIPKEYQNINPGEKVWFTTKIFNLANKERIDIILEYELLQEEKSITKKTETVAMQTQASFVGNLDIPKGTNEGNYRLQVSIITENKTVTGTTTIHINKEETILEYSKKYWKYPTTIIGILLIALTIIKIKPTYKIWIKKKKIHKKIKTIINKKIEKQEITKEELQKSTLKDKKEKRKEEEKIY